MVMKIVVVSCVIFETIKVYRPIMNMRAHKAYILHTDKSMDTRKGATYAHFVGEVAAHLGKDPAIEVVFRRGKFYVFEESMKILFKILRHEISEGNKVYVNISAGPPSFIASAMVACMMTGASPFIVQTDEFTVPEKSYFENGKPVGITKSIKEDVFEPSQFAINPPEEEKVVVFRKYVNEMKNGRGPTGSFMVSELKKTMVGGDYLMSPDNDSSSPANDLMYYRRNYQEKWVADGWLKRVKNGRYEVTPEGKSILNIFYVPGE